MTNEHEVTLDKIEANVEKKGCVNQFFTGFFMPFKALKLFLFKPKYWHYLALPLGINILIYGILAFLCWLYIFPVINNFIATPDPDSYWQWLYTIWNFVAGFITIILYGITIVFGFSLLFFVVAAPFADLLAERIEADIYNYEIKVNGFKEYLRLFTVSIYDGIVLNIKILIVTILFFPLTFIPIIGFLPLFIVSSYFYGTAFLVFSSEHHRVRQKEFLKKMKENFWLCLGLGLCLYLSNYIPLLPIIIYPAGVIAGTMIFNEYLTNKKQ